MTGKRMLKSLLLLTISFLLISTQDVHAQYIDPGTGSYLVQLLLAGFLALIFFFKNPKALLKTLKDKVFKQRDVE